MDAGGEARAEQCPVEVKKVVEAAAAAVVLVVMAAGVVEGVGSAWGCVQSHRPAIGPWRGRDGGANDTTPCTP